MDTVEALRSALASEADVQLVVSNHLLDTPEFRALMQNLDQGEPPDPLNPASLLQPPNQALLHILVIPPPPPPATLPRNVSVPVRLSTRCIYSPKDRRTYLCHIPCYSFFMFFFFCFVLNFSLHFPFILSLSFYICIPFSVFLSFTCFIPYYLTVFPPLSPFLVSPFPLHLFSFFMFFLRSVVDISPCSGSGYTGAYGIF